VLLLGRALALEWAPQGINVDVVGPGVTATAMNAAFLADPTQREPLLARIPLHRPATPAEIAAMVALSRLRRGRLHDWRLRSRRRRLAGKRLTRSPP
jgi:NAD(P)-dependent dehydrogenase (short-subunit alcohol dehydrogenase family)